MSKGHWSPILRKPELAQPAPLGLVATGPLCGCGCLHACEAKGTLTITRLLFPKLLKVSGSGQLKQGDRHAEDRTGAVVQWKAPSQGLVLLGCAQPWIYPLQQTLQPVLAPSDHRNPPSPGTKRLAALARPSSKRQHPSQRWGLVYESCLQLLRPDTHPESH